MSRGYTNFSKGKRSTNATTNQLTQILTYLRLEKRATSNQIRLNTGILAHYINPALHWLVFHKLVKKERKNGGTIAYSLEVKNG